MYKYCLRTLIIVLALALSPFHSHAEATIESGKSLFKNNCAQCHNKNMKKDATGPALGGAQERWADYSQEELYTWVRNSQSLVKAGHPRAVALYSEWKSVMQAFPNLTDEDINSLFLYIDCTYEGTCGGGPPVDPLSVATNGVAANQSTPNWVYYGLLAFLGFLALILARIISNLNVISAAKRGETFERKTLLQTLTSKGVISFALFAAVILGGYTTVNNSINLGRQQGYAPEQPIKFSHETHAGLHQIDCQYCHDGARRSKHAVIPATNTCMNCHRAINVGSEHGTAEITKIYASIGYNPSNNTYIENYEDMHQDTIQKIYSKWIADTYKSENNLEELDREGKKVVAAQWDGIVSSLTNEQKKGVQGPIEWVRIHNLPDHVYFNHSQHVTVGKLECQNCHGAVEEMATMTQHSPLSMGWCINCHRETEVQFGDNEYYKSYVKYHEELGGPDRDKVTVEDIGGLECQKCHY